MTTLTLKTWGLCQNIWVMYKWLTGNPELVPLPSRRKLRLFSCVIHRLLWLRSRPVLPGFEMTRSHDALKRAELMAERGGDASVKGTWGHTYWVDHDDAVEAATQAVSAVDHLQLGEGPAVLRDVIGNPLNPPGAEGGWANWNGGMLAKMAAAVYEEGAFDRLPVLADALEDAGCPHQDMIDHCRGVCPHCKGRGVVATRISDDGVGRSTADLPCPDCRGGGTVLHARGCWVVDALLGKR